MSYPKKMICELWRRFGHSFNMTYESTYMCHVSLHLGERAGEYRFGIQDIAIEAILRNRGLLEG